MAHRSIGGAVAGFLAISLLSGCSEIAKIKDLVEDTLGSANFGFPVDFSDPNASYSAEIKVVDTTRAPVAGASLAINGTTYAADAKGLIKVEGLKVNEILSASVVAEGYMRGPVKLSYSKAGQGAAVVQLTPVEVSVVMDSSLGGTVAGQTVRATFQKDSFVRAAAPGSSPAFRPLADEPYTGQVTVNLASIDVNSQVFEKTEDDGTLVLRSDVTPDRVPSGFFTSVGEDGLERSVLPESVLAVEMYDEDGNPLQLAEGKEATIGLQLPTISGQSEGKSMNILSYDETSSVWRDDSTCQVQQALGTDGEASGKKECVGQVSHFTLKTVATSGTLSTCVRMQFLLRSSVEEANKDNLRYQHMEVLTGVKNADDTYAIRANDTDYLTDASMCYHGSLTFVRTVVQFRKKSDNSLVEEYKTPWFLPSKRGIKAGTVPNEICAECSVLVYQQPVEQGKASGSTPVVQPVDADNDGYVAAKDCDDKDPNVNPGAAEDICGSAGKDLNCDGVVPPTTIAIPANNATSDKINAWNSTYCAKANAGLTCVAKAASDTGGNGIDEDCDGVISDRDGDGQFGLTDSDDNGRIDDCDDANAKVNQNATESNETAADDDCDGVASYDECKGVKNTCGANSTCSDADLTSVNAISCTCDDGYALTNGVCALPQSTDTTPPNTTLASSGPSGTVSDTGATFTFTCSETSCTFECKLDSGPYTTCASPKSYASLADGSHTFSVRAKDAANNVDASPATRTWTINTGGGGGGGSAPTTSILSSPSGTITVDTADVTFSGSVDAEWFECALVTPSSTTITEMDYYPCSSPETLVSLSSGTYKFAVRAAKSLEVPPYAEYDAMPEEVIFTVELAPAAPPLLAPAKVGGCIVSAGNLYCWAGPYAGGTPLSASATGDWVDISVGDSSQAINLGLNFICGIRDGGTLYCWGNNSNGQLGQGNTTDLGSITQVGSATWITVATGTETTCGIQTDTRPYCWGKGDYGQLGTGGTGDVYSPALVSTTTGWTDIALGGSYMGFACGIRGTGDLYCWGNNSSGQLGLGDTAQRLTPQLVAGSSWLQVALGDATACGIKAPGTLWCWGSDVNYQIGDGAADGSTNAPVQVGTDTDWAEVTLGNQHVCALKTEGSLWCWGYEFHDELGDGPGNAGADIPTQIGVGLNWTAVVAGPDVTLGAQGSSPYGWGYDWSGQTGTGMGSGADCNSSLGPDCVVPIPMAITLP